MGKISMRTILVVCVVLFAPVSMAAVAPDGDDAASLDAISWMVGGKWVAETAGPDGKPVQVETVLEWTHHKKGIKFQTFFLAGDEPAPAYEGIFAWHPEKKRIAYFYVGQRGALSEGTLWQEGDVLVQELETLEPDGSSQNLRTHILRQGKDSYDWIVFVQRDSEWAEAMRLTYHRRPLAEDSELETGERTVCLSKSSRTRTASGTR